MPVRRSSAVHTLGSASPSDPLLVSPHPHPPCICSHLRHPTHEEQIGGLSGPCWLIFLCIHSQILFSSDPGRGDPGRRSINLPLSSLPLTTPCHLCQPCVPLTHAPQTRHPFRAPSPRHIPRLPPSAHLHGLCRHRLLQCHRTHHPLSLDLQTPRQRLLLVSPRCLLKHLPAMRRIYSPLLPTPNLTLRLRHSYHDRLVRHDHWPLTRPLVPSPSRPPGPDNPSISTPSHHSG